MQINNSSFLYGQQGLQRSQDKLDQASHKVAQASTQTISQNPSRNSGVYGSSIQEGLIDAKSGQLDAQANAKVIDSSNKTIGSLIDIMA